MEDGGHHILGTLLFLVAAVLPTSLGTSPLIGDYGDYDLSTLPPPPACSYDIDEDTLFASHNFPKKYDENLLCNYTLRGPEGKKIHLTFHHFQMPSYCNKDSGDALMVYDSDGSLIRILCGSIQRNEYIVSSGSNLTLQMRSDNWVSSDSMWLASFQDFSAGRDRDKDEGPYLITMPRKLIAGISDKVCVQLLGKDFEQVMVDITVYSAEREDALEEDGEIEKWELPKFKVLSTNQITIEGGGNQMACENLVLLEKENANNLIKFEFSGSRNQYDFSTFRLANGDRSREVSVIQTDKGKYKPGDKVRFRILLLDDQLKPDQDVTSIKSIWVTDSENNRIQQWDDVQLKSGMMQQEFELGEEPVLGRYTIEYGTEKDDERGRQSTDRVNFEVMEYVLPKFEVNIKPPRVILLDGSVGREFEVCGVYTHGEPVPGVAKISFRADNYPRHSYRWRPNRGGRQEVVYDKEAKVTTRKGDKCAKFQLSMEEFNVLTSKNTPLRVNTTFVEDGTETSETAQWSGNAESKQYLINFENAASDFIMGGMPYQAKLKVTEHGGAPRANAQVKVCASLYRSLSEVRDAFSNIWNMNEADLYAKRDLLNNLQFGSKCSELTTDETGTIKFYTPLTNIPDDVVRLTIVAKAMDVEVDKASKMIVPEEKLEVSISNAKDLAFALGSPDDIKLTCGEESTVTVYTAVKKELTEPVYVNYVLMGKDSTIRNGNLTIDNSDVDQREELYKDRTEIRANDAEENVDDWKVVLKEVQLMIDLEASPELKVLLMKLDPNNTITTSKALKVEPCFNHMVKAKLSKSVSAPGGDVSLNLQGDPKSKCGVSLTDKSVELLGNPNKVTGQRLSSLVTELRNFRREYSSYSYEFNNKCPEASKRVKEFEFSGGMAITNLNSMSCPQTWVDHLAQLREQENNPGRPEPAMYDVVPTATSMMSSGPPGSRGRPRPPPLPVPRRGMSNMEDDSEPRLRSYFPETWLFDLVDLDDEGQSVSETVAPDTITSWTAESFCMSPTNGFGVAKPQRLVVKQDFFADLRLPYSVKRGEKFLLNITISNQMKEQRLPVSISIDTDEDTLDMDIEDSEIKFCLDPSSQEVVVVPSTAKAVGDVNITVNALVTDDEACNKVENINQKGDRLVKPLRVKAEGIPKEVVSSAFTCLTEETGTTGKIEMERLEVPADAVPDSSRAFLRLTGDVMAPALDNLDNMVTMPTGCGEQNMIRLAPNIYLLKYLQETGQANKDLQRKAKKYMKIGYDRQQRYRRDDGSFSIWGSRDEEGSTWLTAFVVKTFAEAEDYMTIDLKKLKESVDWLKNKTDSDGCFIRYGYVHSSSLPGGTSTSSDALTPYVALALLTAMDSVNMKSISDDGWVDHDDGSLIVNAANCALKRFKSNGGDDVYTASILGYLMSKINSTPGLGNVTGLEEINTMLEEAAKKEAGDYYWEKVTKNPKWYWYPYSRSKAVEMTAYNVLRFTQLDQLADAAQSVKWLARQRNSRGGFISTQDTVMAIQAISLYSSKVFTDEPALSVVLTEAVNGLSDTEGGKTEEINDSNKLLLREERLPDVTAVQLSADMEGQGCAMAQTILRYNLPDSPPENGFKLEVNHKTSTPNEEGEVLEICAQYTGDRNNSEMVIIEVELLSGYDAVNPMSLINEIDSGVERVEQEVEDNIVILYFNDIPKENSKCILMMVAQDVSVEERKPARASIYGYYNPEDKTEILYTEGK